MIDRAASHRPRRIGALTLTALDGIDPFANRCHATEGSRWAGENNAERVMREREGIISGLLIWVGKQ